MCDVCYTRGVAVERINSDKLLPPHGHTHVTKVLSGTTVYLSGQGAFTADSKLVGEGDYYVQSRQAFENVLIALESAGATFADVVKATYYVVNLDPDALGGFVRAMGEVVGDRFGPPPSATMVGVQALGLPGMLVEIDVTAVIDS